MIDFLQVAVGADFEGRVGAPDTDSRQITVEVIQRAVGQRYGYGLAEMRSARREHPLVLARHVAMWLCKHETSRSFPELGRLFGGRDHTTVMYGVRRVAALMERDPAFDTEVRSLRFALTKGHLA